MKQKNTRALLYNRLCGGHDGLARCPYLISFKFQLIHVLFVKIRVSYRKTTLGLFKG